jgi:hypothetical protein
MQKMGSWCRGMPRHQLTDHDPINFQTSRYTTNEDCGTVAEALLVHALAHLLLCYRSLIGVQRHERAAPTSRHRKAARAALCASTFRTSVVDRPT